MPGALYTHTVRGNIVLTAAIYNQDHQNHIDNGDAAHLGGYSSNVTEMRIKFDPGGIGTEHLPASIAEELGAIRFQLNRIIGGTQWYETPPTDLATAGAGVIPAGTRMVFFQAAAPTGWTKITTQNDKVLRVVSGTGGGAGGSWTIGGLSSPSHSHSWGGGATSTGAPSATAGTQSGAFSVASSSHTHTIGAAATTSTAVGVSSDASWRPSYIDVIICSKN